MKERERKKKFIFRLISTKNRIKGEKRGVALLGRAIFPFVGVINYDISIIAATHLPLGLLILPASHLKMLDDLDLLYNKINVNRQKGEKEVTNIWLGLKITNLTKSTKFSGAIKKLKPGQKALEARAEPGNRKLALGICRTDAINVLLQEAINPLRITAFDSPSWRLQTRDSLCF